MIYVISSVVGGFDNIRPPMVPVPLEDGVRFICFTDFPLQPAVAPWEFRPALPIYADELTYSEPQFSGARTSRVPKILPHLMLPIDADYSIWHDANFQLRMSPRQMIGDLLKVHDWASHKHPARDGIYPESEVLLSERIGTPELVRQEVARYREMKHPDHAGLWANGLIIRRHTPAVAALNERWWQLYSTGCERDQLSFPVARRELGMPVETIQSDVYNGPYMKFNWHAAWKLKDDNPSYWPERGRLREQAKILGAVTDTRVPYPEY